MSVRATQWVVLVVAAGIVGGCVERAFLFTSEPSGALVYVSDVEVGRTPLRMPFTFYGTYDVRLMKDGYETLNVGWQVNPPLYDIPPFDLLSELAPWTYRVERHAHFNLKEAEPTSDADLLRRAGLLREGTVEPGGK